MIRIFDAKLLLGLGFVLLVTTGCAPTKQPPGKRYFWPPIQGAEKLEHVKTIFSSRDVTAGSESWLFEMVFGVERPQMLFSRPHYLISDKNGRLFVEDTGLNQVRVLDIPNKKVSSLKGVKGDDAFVFGFPSGMALDSMDRLWVVDNLQRKIFVFDPSGRLSKEVKLSATGRFSGMVWDGVTRSFYLVATEEHRLLVLDEHGSLINTIGKRGNAPGEFNFPTDVAVDSQGQIYVLDSLNARVQVLSSDGSFVREFGERGTALGSFQIPKGIAVSPEGYVFVTDGMAHKVVIFSANGEFLLTFGGRFSISQGSYAPGGFNMPQGIHVDRNGTVWVADTLNRSVQRFQLLTDDYLRDHPILPGQSAPVAVP